MTWAIYGFMLGLTLGTVMLGLGVQMTKRRMQQALEGLLEEGRFRVQSRDGAPVNGRSLVEALDSAFGRAAPGMTANKLVVAALVVAGAAAGVLLVTLA